MAKRQDRGASTGNARTSQVDQDDSFALWDPHRSEVVRNLLTSAVRCFAANGYHATTTRDISAGGGLSPAALYVHFPSKELVLFEIIRTGHERVMAYIADPIIDAADNAADQLRLLISRYTAWHARHNMVARVCQYELAALDPDHYEHVTGLRRRTNEIFREAVARGVREGVFADIDVNRVVRAMLSLSIDLIRWYKIDGDDTPEQLGDFYADLALAMVTTPASLRPLRAPSSESAPLAIE